MNAVSSDPRALFVERINKGEQHVGYILKSPRGDYVVVNADECVNIKKRHFDAFIESQGHTQMATVNVVIGELCTTKQIKKAALRWRELTWYQRILRCVLYRDPLGINDFLPSK